MQPTIKLTPILTASGDTYFNIKIERDKISHLIEMGPKTYLSLLFSVIALSTSVFAINYIIQRTLKLPFTNTLNNANQMFTSPLSIIFFTSGIIWLIGSIYKCCTTAIFCNDQSLNLNQELESSYDFERNNLSGQIQHDFSANPDKSQAAKDQNTSFNKLPTPTVLKIVIPNFLELLSFFYGILYLSFPKVIIFKIISRIGLTPLFESIFIADSCHLKKFCISILAFAGFSLFNYSFLDSPQLERDEKLYKDNIIYGYMFVIAMCYLGLIKKIFQKQVNQTYGTWSGDGWVLTQAKVNSTGSYLLMLLLKQEIYGSVFAVLHTQFLLQILALTILLALVIHLKKYIVNTFSQVLGNFVSILQKNLSLIASVILFGQGINSGQIFGVCIIALTAFLQFLMGFCDTEEVKGNENERTFLSRFGLSNKKIASNKIFTKSDDVKDNDEKKSLRV